MKRVLLMVSIFVLLLSGVGLVVALQIMPSSRADQIKGQMNITMTFYGQVIDQDGHPLPGVKIEYRLEAYPKDWTFKTRDRLNDASYIAAISGTDGKFQIDVYGCSLRRKSIALNGYRYFAELDVHGSAEHVQTEWYCLIAQGDQWFKSDPEHPAIYVMVKDGVKEVSALPCHGGYSSGGSTIWRLNEPGWPEEPSLKDVVRKMPTTIATTLPSTHP